MSKSIFFSILAFVLASPSTALAQKLSNPLGEGVTIYDVIGRIIRALLGLSGAAALLMFVWGGFLWLTSRGEPGPITKGKDTIKWAIFGLVIIFLAYTLVSAVISALTEGTAIVGPSEE